MENTNTKKLKIKKSLVDELFEDKDFDEKIVKTFYCKNKLSPDVFQSSNGSYKINELVRDKLLNVTDEFMNFLGLDFFVHDVVLTGSLSNYNWSEYSDVDLHIIIDYEESGHNKTLLKEFFDAKKDMWNSSHHITIKKYIVEIYVQDISEPHVSSGVYSVLNNKWIVEPQKDKHSIDDRLILDKSEEYMSQIDNVIEKNDKGDDISEDIKNIKNKLKRFRQSGLKKDGEYSYENLTFKLLRRNGYVKKLLDLKQSTSSKKLSINETPDQVVDNAAMYHDKDGIPFGFYEGNMIIGFNGSLIPSELYGKLETEFLSKEVSILDRNVAFLFGKGDYSIHPEMPYFYEMLYRLGIEKNKIEFIPPKGHPMQFWRTMFKYPGRLWYQKKILSFWEFPRDKNELLKILYGINGEMKKIYNTTLNFNEYSIEVRSENPDETVTEYELIPVNEYVGGYINSTDDELKASHLLSPEEKEKDPQLQAVKQSNIERARNIEKNWGSIANRHHILNKNVAENKS